MKLHKCHIDLRSALVGILAMRFHRRPRHPHDYKRSIEMKRDGITHGAGWGIDFGKFGWGMAFWTPIYHEGRGPYLTLLLGKIRITRGY